ncbi:Predicted nucleotide-utilizing enzyme [Polaromonas sp. OV174]|uniref:competence/damage-inducible protein A n=1 Tax=Polaromonas sp. OV174 TaxID=1855300 RepID=UPI0008E60EBA|nr:molybdopterin-binding protein [Polaromonas sp. OV174]SFB74870.1 Predicted nucleotide-utilizing enzyme [Polaromonas sp. OV174]
MSTHFGLIIIGDEILSGKRADKHLPKVIELLGARGLQLAYADCVGDDPARITATLKRAFAAARETGDAVFSCGGIGATPDDHTRQCAARALGLELALHPQAEALIRERMQDMAKEQGVPYQPEHPDNVHRLNMGMFPVGAQIIPNPYNKIPGFSCFVGPQATVADSETQPGSRNGLRPAAGAAAPPGGRELHEVSDRGGVHFVPGFPVMAWPMIEWVLDQRYAHLHQALAYAEKSVIVMGSMEAMLTPLMLAIEAAHPGVKVFSLPSVDHPEFGRHIELGVKGSPEAVKLAYSALMAGLQRFDLKLGPELVR